MKKRFQPEFTERIIPNQIYNFSNGEDGKNHEIHQKSHKDPEKSMFIKR